MFGNMFGDLESSQKAMNERLSNIRISVEVEDGAIVVAVNGNQEVLDISINRNKLNWDDTEQLEDLMLVAINTALSDAREKAAEEAQHMLKEILPPGMDDIGNLFG